MSIRKPKWRRELRQLEKKLGAPSTINENVYSDADGNAGLGKGQSKPRAASAQPSKAHIQSAFAINENIDSDADSMAGLGQEQPKPRAPAAQPSKVHVQSAFTINGSVYSKRRNDGGASSTRGKTRSSFSPRSFGVRHQRKCLFRRRRQGRVRQRTVET